MLAKDNFHIGKKYLKNAHYTLGLGNDNYASSFAERLILGPADFDEAEPRFSKRAIVIPASCYIDLTRAIQKAYDCFQREDPQENFEVVLFRHSKVHHIVARYETWASDDSPDEPQPAFKILIRWFYKKDSNYQRLVDSGIKPQIDPDLQSSDSLFLKRGLYLGKDQTEILYHQLETLFEHSFYELDSKEIVMNFVDFVMSKDKLRSFVEEKLEHYKDMAYPTKMKIIRHLVTEMFEDKRLGPDTEHFGMKRCMNALSNKVALVFSLFAYRLALMVAPPTLSLETDDYN